MEMFLDFLILFCVTQVGSQIHDVKLHDAPCYDCDSLPCRQRLTCGLNEVCQVNYDHHSVHFHISCWEAQECQHTIHLGGRQQFCCTDQACLDQALIWLQNRLATERSTTSVPGGQTSGSHDMTLNYDAISCDYLANQSCAVMDALCSHVNCPHICKKCFKPIVTIPTTTAPVGGSHVTVDYGDISCDRLANQGCGILDAVCPHVNCPLVCSKCFKPIVTVPTTTTTQAPLIAHHGSDVVINYDAISCDMLAKQECAFMDVVCPHVNCPEACKICFSPIKQVSTSPSP